VALDRELRDSDPTRWAAELTSAEDATHEAMAEIKRLRTGTQDATYQLVCPRGHTPRITAARLADAVRNAPNNAVTPNMPVRGAAKHSDPAAATSLNVVRSSLLGRP
jgi:hypothetical protein